MNVSHKHTLHIRHPYRNVAFFSEPILPKGMVHPAGNTILKTCLLNDHIRRCQVIIVGMLPTPRFVRPIGLLLTSAQFVRLRSHDLPCHEWHQQSTVYSNDLSCIYAYMWRQNEFMVEFERISSKMKIKKFIRITTVSRLLLNQ